VAVAVVVTVAVVVAVTVAGSVKSTFLVVASWSLFGPLATTYKTVSAVGYCCCSKTPSAPIVVLVLLVELGLLASTIVADKVYRISAKLSLASAADSKQKRLLGKCAGNCH
jgi:hypothetical protein